MGFRKHGEVTEDFQKLGFFLPINEQQEFLELSKIIEAFYFMFPGSGELNFNKDSLGNEEKVILERYSYLLKRAEDLSKKDIEDRLAILLLSIEEQDRFFELWRIIEGSEESFFRYKQIKVDDLLGEAHRISLKAQALYEEKNISFNLGKYNKKATDVIKE